jgi:hypothetical protein
LRLGSVKSSSSKKSMELNLFLFLSLEKTCCSKVLDRWSKSARKLSITTLLSDFIWLHVTNSLRFLPTAQPLSAVSTSQLLRVVSKASSYPSLLITNSPNLKRGRQSFSRMKNDSRFN